MLTTKESAYGYPTTSGHAPVRSNREALLSKTNHQVNTTHSNERGDLLLKSANIQKDYDDTFGGNIDDANDRLKDSSNNANDNRDGNNKDNDDGGHTDSENQDADVNDRGDDNDHVGGGDEYMDDSGGICLFLYHSLN